jgi:hypothetical protein
MTREEIKALATEVLEIRRRFCVGAPVMPISDMHNQEISASPRLAQAYLDLDARAQKLLIAANNLIECNSIERMNALIRAAEVFAQEKK